MRAQLASGKRVPRPPVMPQTWKYPAAQEQVYANQIAAIVKPFTDIVSGFLVAYPSWVRNDGLHADGFAQDWDKAMQALRAHQKKVFEDNDGRDAYAMVNSIGESVSTFNFKQWSAYLSKLAGQPYYPPAEPWVAGTVETWSDANFELIRSLTDDYIKQVNTKVVDAVTSGTSYADLTKAIQKINTNISKPRARLIARDQVGKLNGQLTGRRQTDAGVEEYTWKTAQDERVRSTHSIMQGKACEWKDATKYKISGGWVGRLAGMTQHHPGYDIQCRCYASPNMDAIWAEAEQVAKEEGWYEPRKSVAPLYVPPPRPVAARKPATPTAVPAVAPTGTPPSVAPTTVAKPIRKKYPKHNFGTTKPVITPAKPITPAIVVPAKEAAKPMTPAVTKEKKPTVYKIKTPETKKAFAGAPEWLQNAVGRADKDFRGQIPDQADQGAYYSPGMLRVHMGAPYRAGGRHEKDFDAVWRHETGHHLDHMAGPRGGRFGSHTWEEKKIGATRDRIFASAKIPKAGAMNATEILTNRFGAEKAAKITDLLFETFGEEDWRGVLENFASGNHYGMARSVHPRSFGSTTFEKGSLMDVFAAATKNELGYGHSTEYWGREGTRATEIFAQFTTLTGHPKNGKVWASVLNDIFPELYSDWENTVKKYGGAL